MGGQYFSNGIALNTIEDRSSEEAEQGIPEEQRSGAAEETWDNINAIDDIVEFLAGDSHDERSDFLKDTISLTQRGIVTVAAMRGNAAAGGVALAAACDVVMVTDNVILNPAYRAMGLHGSELHSCVFDPRPADIPS
jgi:enoyl-CoA hydratase/carnithine racemase